MSATIMSMVMRLPDSLPALGGVGRLRPARGGAQPTEASSDSPVDTSIRVRVLRSHPARSPGTNQAQVNAAELGADDLSGDADKIQPDGVHICDKDLGRSRVNNEKPHDFNVSAHEMATPGLLRHRCGHQRPTPTLQ